MGGFRVRRRPGRCHCLRAWFGAVHFLCDCGWVSKVCVSAVISGKLSSRGSVSERPKVQHSKCCVVQATPGSNPGATAINSRHAMRGGIFCFRLGCKTGGGGPRSPACTIFKTTNVVVFYVHIVLWKDFHMFNPSAQSAFEITVDEQLAELDLTGSS